jgi:hypothetical protein
VPIEPPGDATIGAMITGAALLLALLLQSTGSAAAASDAPTTRARLILRGAADCITGADLAARIAARSTRIQLADEAAISAEVSVASPAPGNVIAELILTSGGERQSPRRIVARSCTEAADAIALIVAVTLDPTVRRKTPAPADVASPSGPKPPQSAAASASPPPAVAKTPVPPAIVEATEPRPPALPVRTPRELGVFLAGQTIFGPAPSVMPGIALHGMAALAREGVWAPALFVGLTHAWRQRISEAGGDASFTLDAATIDACPLRVRLSWLAARPCASALVGRIAATGSRTENGSSAARPFAVAGAAATATAGSTVSLFVRLALGITLVRDEYEFGGDVFYRSGRLTASASVGVGLRWP